MDQLPRGALRCMNRCLDTLAIAEIFETFKKFTENATILCNEQHPRLNNFAAFLKGNKDIKVQNTDVKIIPLNMEEVMKIIHGNDDNNATFIIVAPVDTKDLQLIKTEAAKDGKDVYILTNDEVDKAISRGLTPFTVIRSKEEFMKAFGFDA